MISTALPNPETASIEVMVAETILDEPKEGPMIAQLLHTTPKILRARLALPPTPAVICAVQIITARNQLRLAQRTLQASIGSGPDVPV